MKKKPQLSIMIDIDFWSERQEELWESMFLALLCQMWKEIEQRHKKNKVEVKRVKRFSLKVEQCQKWEL